MLMGIYKIIFFSQFEWSATHLYCGIIFWKKLLYFFISVIISGTAEAMWGHNGVSSVGVSPCNDKVHFLRPEMMNVSQTGYPPVAI